MFFTLLSSAMCLNSWCTLEAMFEFLTFPPFCMWKYEKKDDFASILTAWFYFVLAKKFDILVRKYVCFMYQVSIISKLLTLNSFRTDNFDGKIGSFIIFKMADCTQRNLSKSTRKLTIIQWFYSNITNMRYTYQLILLYSVRIFSI